MFRYFVVRRSMEISVECGGLAHHVTCASKGHDRVSGIPREATSALELPKGLQYLTVHPFECVSN